MVTALERHKAVTEALGASTTARLATATASRSAATAVTHRQRLTTSSHTCHCKIISFAHANTQPKWARTVLSELVFNSVVKHQLL
jgi:hypothetical protein